MTTMKVRRSGHGFEALPDAPFDVDQFLALPLVARVATSGPVVRPVWFLWEDEIFWVLIGPWSQLGRRLRRNPVFELVVDSCLITTGEVRQVIARGHGYEVPFDTTRGRRKLTRYLGDQEELWDERFSLRGDPNQRGIRWGKLVPEMLRIADRSFQASLGRSVPPPPGVSGGRPG